MEVKQQMQEGQKIEAESGPGNPIWAAIGFILIGVILFVVNPFSGLEAPEMTQGNTAESSLRNPGMLPADFSEIPLRLRIPKIGVDASFEPVGVLADGSMGVPKQPERVGWYAFGPRPGERGDAVVAGHRGWKEGAAVFDRLSELRVGDTVLVADADNQWHTFIVRGSKIFDPAEDTTEVFDRKHGTKGGIRLNLITCDGEWSRSAGQFTKRLVVFTEGI